MFLTHKKVKAKINKMFIKYCTFGIAFSHSTKHQNYLHWTCWV